MTNLNDYKLVENWKIRVYVPKAEWENYLKRGIARQHLTSETSEQHARGLILSAAMDYFYAQKEFNALDSTEIIISDEELEEHVKQQLIQLYLVRHMGDMEYGNYLYKKLYSPHFDLYKSWHRMEVEAASWAESQFWGVDWEKEREDWQKSLLFDLEAEKHLKKQRMGKCKGWIIESKA